MKLVNLAKTAAVVSFVHLKNVLHKEDIPLSQQVKQVMDLVYSKGYCVVQNFLSIDECQSLREEVDQVLAAHADELWKDKIGADKRAFGIDRVSEKIKSLFYKHSFIVATREAYYQLGEQHLLGCTMANRIEAKSNNLGSGGGWHRDSVNVRQFKAILYLTDVTEKNGAFQYVTGTQDRNTVFEGILKHSFHYKHNRFTPKEIEKILVDRKHELHTLTGKAGTLILVDTSGIHRGKPIEVGVRYALTNYYWIRKEKGGKDIPIDIQKIMLKK
ncbi:MAG: phytanoyl-CoA dioxygenase family protein [Flavobacteriaceae bacterium]